MTMVKAKLKVTDGYKKITDLTRGCVKGQWPCIGTIIILLSGANLWHLQEHLNVNGFNTSDEGSGKALSSIRYDSIVQTTAKKFCQEIYEAEEFLEPPNELRRKMVHVFVANSGHLPLLRNSLVSIRRLPTRWKSIVFALDDKLCPDLRQQSPELSPICIYYAPRLLQQMKRDEPEFYRAHMNKTGEEVSLHETAVWATEMHTVLINSKLYGRREILNCGLDVFLTDADIVFLKDPRPYFVGEDIIAQHDHRPEHKKPLRTLNSGFMFWRHTPQNLNLSQALIKEPSQWQAREQLRVNRLFRAKRIRVTILPSNQFPNGAMMRAKDQNGNQIPLSKEAVVAHANFNQHLDQKRELLSKHGLWLIP